MDTNSANLAAAITQLQASVAKLAEELTATSATADPFRECESPETMGETAVKKEGAKEMEVDPEVAQSVATQLGVEGGGKRILEIIAAASAAAKKSKTCP